MASLGDLVVNLVADSSRFQKGLKDAEGYLNAFGAAAATFAAGSVFSFMQVGSAFDDMAQRTGISVEALSALSHAAQMSDTSMESLQSALVKMTKFIEGAASGSGEASKALGELGLSASQLKGMGPEEQFKTIADALNAISDPGKRAIAAMEVFGKGAADIKILLNEGSEGISRFTDEAHRTGKVMTTETAKAAADTADAFDNMLGSIKMLIVAFGKELAPLVRMAADAITYLVSQHGDFINIVGITALAIGSVVLAYKAVTRVTQAYAQAKAIALALSGPKGWIALGIALGAAVGATAALTSEFNRQNAELERQVGVLNDVQKAQKALNDARARLARPQGKSDFEARGERLAALQKQFAELQTQSAQGQIDAFRGKIAQLTDDFRTLEINGRAAMTPEQFAKYKQAAIDAFTGITDAVADLQSELAVLRGEVTKQEQEFARFAKMGASPEQLQQLRALNAERDALLQKQREEQKINEESAAYWAKRVADQKAEAAAAKDRAAAIIDSIKTPEERLSEQLADINKLRERGLLTAEQASKAAEKARLDAAGQSQQGAGSEPRFAQAMLRGSTEAYSTILRAMAGSPEANATKEQTKVLGKKLDAIAQKPPAQFQVVESLNA